MTVPVCRVYDRLGVRDFYDYLQTGREPKPIAASGDVPKPPKRTR